MLDRRSFLSGLGAAIAAGVARAGARPEIYIACCMERGGSDAAAVAAFSADGALLFKTRLPARGHDVVVRPGGTQAVVFARRPGNWAAVVDLPSGRVERVVTTPPDRHFYGHGAFSADGRLLYATENRMGTGQGVLGIYDAEAGFRRVDERPSFGPGPHDIARLPGAANHLVVANGGTRTEPESGRTILNADAMDPSLVVLDAATGAIRAKAELGADLAPLSIRHLAVAHDGRVAFGCQWEGDPAVAPPLVGVLGPDGRARLFDLPDEAVAALDNYVGSVALDAAQRIVAATSPRGNAVAYWDVASGRYLGRTRLSDACGIAALRRAGEAAGGLFVVSSGNAGVQRIVALDRAPRRLGEALAREAWDNHVRLIEGAGG